MIFAVDRRGLAALHGHNEDSVRSKRRITKFGFYEQGHLLACVRASERASERARERERERERQTDRQERQDSERTDLSR